ncbi:MAG: tetratricopeptide repeat protein [Spirochaetaceae bacterium]|jgi:tetratricopeptide (TPR) repeat protein|nr:tetratricopeptide repeat protein [Spirochaetaceae bacterium]
MKIRFIKIFTVKLTFLLFVLCGLNVCSVNGGDYHLQNLDYYLKNTGDKKSLFQELFTELTTEETKQNVQFALIQEISNQYDRLNDSLRLINFLSEWINKHPDDPYNSYYLLRIANCYMHMDSKPAAALYFDTIVRNYPDLIVRNNSIHFACFQELINITHNPYQKIWYYEQIISRFPEKINLGESYFKEGQLYEQIGKWKEAIAAYNNFKPFYGAIIQGFPNAYAYARQMTSISSILKNHPSESGKLERTFENLPELLSVICRIMDDGDTYQLWNYRTRANFFAASWTQIGEDDEQTNEFTISTLSAPGAIQYSKELSSDSNASDVYLKTWGWTRFSPVWYFYFRKIYFPMEPALNGRWEWAGIYYGEKF